MKGYISPVEARERGHANHMYPADCARCGTTTMHECADGHAWCRACGLHEVSDTELAWAAGFLDGDGCFTLNKHSSRATHPSGRSLVMNAVQVSRQPLEFLESLFGGRVTRLGMTKRGSEIWQWRIADAAEIRRVIPLVLPYLKLKKREAEIVLAFAHTVRPRGKVPNGIDPNPPEMVAQRMALISELEIIRGRGGEVMSG